MLFMRKQWQQRKVNMIKSYCQKSDNLNQNASGKHQKLALQAEREQIEVHLAIIDLITVCARNSPFGIFQAQKLIHCEELIDTILTDQVPFLLKKHYLALLWEVYMRKVPGIEPEYRLGIKDLKFA